MKTHQAIDLRSLAMHCLVVEKIRKNPALFEQVKITLAHWRDVVCPATQPYLEAWDDLLKQGMETSFVVATEDSERGAEMRQSSPFAGILSNKERFAFLRQWKAAHGA